MYFHGARFSNYEAWLADPIGIRPSAQVVWPIVGQEILNGDVGGGFQGFKLLPVSFNCGEVVVLLVNCNCIVQLLVVLFWLVQCFSLAGSITIKLLLVFGSKMLNQ